MFDLFFSLINSLYLFSAGIDGEDCFPKPLSREEEQECLAKVRQGDVDARDKLITHNMRLVVHIAKKYSNYPDTDELISVGSIGLIKAITTFCDGKGTQLATYAARCIENEILMLFRSNKKHKCCVSLYDSVGTDKEGNEMTFIDMLIADGEDVLDKMDDEQYIYRILNKLSTLLEPREYEIIKLRYGVENSDVLTQREIAKRFNISRSYVSRIEKKALTKIRAFLEE